MTPRILIVVLALATGLGGCARIGESRLNPFNWFGQSEPAPVRVAARPADPRPPVAQVTDLAIERAPGGAILRATGLPPTQGWYAAALVRNGDIGADGVLSFTFRAVPPPEPQRVSTPWSRELTVAVYLPDAVLAQVRAIQVSGAANARVVRR